MKLVLQIAFGVFLGTLLSQLIIGSWHTHMEEITKQLAEKNRVEQEKVRLEQGERIRALLLQGRQKNSADSNKAPAGFIPDDAKSPILNQE